MTATELSTSVADIKNILNPKKRKFEPKMLAQLPVENFLDNINILKLVFSLFGST
jgi:hypothetical protein